MDKYEREIIALPNDKVGDFYDGLAKFEKDGMWGFIDKSGQEIIAPSFEDVGDFCNSLAKIKKGGKWGYINQGSQEVVLPQYEAVKDFQGDWATVKRDNKWGLIYRTGQELLKPQYDFIFPFEDGLAWFLDNGKRGLLDQNGQKKFVLSYESVEDFQDGLARIQKGWKYGFINKNGQETVPCYLDNTQLVAKYTHLLLRSGKKGLLFTDEKTYIPPEYDEIANPRDPWVIVMKNNKWGWVDHRGNVKIPCRFDAVTQFNEFGEKGYATVLQFGMQFRINTKGEMIWRMGPDKE